MVLLRVSLLAILTNLIYAQSTTDTTAAVTTTAHPFEHRPHFREICPAYDQKAVRSGPTVYLVQCGTDHYGNDFAAFSPTPATTMAQCLAHCTARPGCLAVSFDAPLEREGLEGLFGEDEWWGDGAHEGVFGGEFGCGGVFGDGCGDVYVHVHVHVHVLEQHGVDQREQRWHYDQPVWPVCPVCGVHVLEQHRFDQRKH
ncbi:hypothetical protein BDV95DRAFT_607177 [Massariosphaeria phaeospora]|uniref:Apple domain-containing protein n=1 Tax=Massariosphaeria phaeospora TaxID=100035 RepID=A0A7C8IFJ7_9PLEO|nr:hypothetical protein BDV95DRAFT_607177 [Massariosphaeria phaeospora]